MRTTSTWTPRIDRPCPSGSGPSLLVPFHMPFHCKHTLFVTRTCQKDNRLLIIIEHGNNQLIKTPTYYPLASTSRGFLMSEGTPHSQWLNNAGDVDDPIAFAASAATRRRQARDDTSGVPRAGRVPLVLTPAQLSCCCCCCFFCWAWPGPLAGQRVALASSFTTPPVAVRNQFLLLVVLAVPARLPGRRSEVVVVW